MDLINSAAQYGLLHGALSRETHVYKSGMKSKRFTNESKIFTAMIFRDETENVPSPQPNRPPCQDPLTFGNLLSTELGIPAKPSGIVQEMASVFGRYIRYKSVAISIQGDVTCIQNKP